MIKRRGTIEVLRVPNDQKVRKRCLGFGEGVQPVGRYWSAPREKKDQGHQHAKNEIAQDDPRCQPQVWHGDGEYVEIKCHHAYFREEDADAKQ
jgi:hypothetical protein